MRPSLPWPSPRRPSRTSRAALRRLAGRAAGAAVGLVFLTGLAPEAAPSSSGPQYDGAGRLIFPVDYREWVFLSSGLNMSYSQTPAMVGQDIFGNTFAAPSAYKTFLKTGVWPDKTVLILEDRGGAAKGSINRQGRFQTTETKGVEAHVKDVGRFKGGWGFFAFDGDKPAALIPATASCYACHQDHAAVDTTFVQFYPTLLPVAIRQKTVSPAYLAESGPP
jgi:hypothetical protein